MQTLGIPAIVSAPGDAEYISTTLSGAQLSAMSLQVALTGGVDVTGSVYVEGSNEQTPAQWFLVPSGSVSIVGNGNEGSPPFAITYKWLRIHWLPSAGTGGTISVTAFLQGGPSPAPDAGTSGGAPIDAQYVTLSANSTLTNERVLTAGSGVTLTDGGPGTTITVAQSTLDPSPAGTYSAATVTVDALGRVTAASSGGLNSATATVDFGTKEQHEASVTVSAAWVGASTRLIVTPLATATAEHDPDDYAAEGVSAVIQNVTAGVGFDVVAFANDTTFGQYNFNVIGVG